MKLTTKLLLGATLVAGLSVSSFAACANDVLMGDKQLKDVADATDDKDAVNYGQMKNTNYPLTLNPDSNLTVMFSTNLSVNVMGNGMVCLEGFLRNLTGGTSSLPTALDVLTLPTEAIPSGTTRVASVTTYLGQHIMFQIKTNGAVNFYVEGSDMANNEGVALDGVCYVK